MIMNDEMCDSHDSGLLVVSMKGRTGRGTRTLVTGGLD